ncbi:hypothetical protein PTE30175_05369 [Pandoraea terrae]|uniref:Uncharacterized protein n=1 Tax=Pandoraea terrae TaxID=1537710 RepID=A0A5E4ZCJ8_9BURK|nr:hypothetical protein PTE30175_05369 [Pandoraea terrae]
MREVRHDVPCRHLLEVELEASREDRDRDLLRIGRRENELDVRGRFFKRLEHRVEGMPGEHVHFVDHIDLEACVGRRIDRLLEQRGHFVDAAVRRGIHFDVIDKTPLIDCPACLADAARLGGDAGLAIERLGQNSRERGLADTACAREQIRMMQALLFERVRKGAHHVLLANQGRETFRAPFAREYLIGHAKL